MSQEGIKQIKVQKEKPKSTHRKREGEGEPPPPETETKKVQKKGEELKDRADKEIKKIDDVIKVARAALDKLKEGFLR